MTAIDIGLSDWSPAVCSSYLFAPFCRSEGIGVINFYSLASGFLTGKYRSAHDVQASRRKKSNQRYLTERGFRILDTLDAVSASLGVKPAQIARSEERRVGKESVSTCRFRWSPYNKKKKK